MKPLIYHRRDYVSYVIMIVYVAVMFVLWRYVKLQLPIPGLK